MDKKSNSTQTISFVPRPPIVTILGHVDHGKTTLLDTIRKTNIAEKEHGGITQHIGAYQIKIPNREEKITFIDTPGHEAFSKMRSRGAEAADIVILVVAANDGVMPQTIESINLIKSLNIPAIVAINKIDLPDINLEKIKKQLTRHKLNLEEYGGDIPTLPISAKNELGIDKLLETIILLAELYQVREDQPGILKSVVIESTLSKNRGPVATVILRSGQLTVGDLIICEDQEFKVRAITDWLGNNMQTISAADPAEILGWPKIPQAGSLIYKKAQIELQKFSKQELSKKTLSPLMENPTEEKNLEERKIKLIVKSDNIGTLEAILGSLPNEVLVIESGVGMIGESDILLAKTTNAIVLGFNLKVSGSVLKLAESEKVILKTYNIIYKLIEEIGDVVQAALHGDLVEVRGEAKIQALFNIKEQMIAGVKVVSGRIAKGDQVKIVRGEQEIGRARIKSLRHGKEDVTLAEQGVEAGVILSQNIAFLTDDSIISIG